MSRGHVAYCSYCCTKKTKKQTIQIVFPYKVQNCIWYEIKKCFKWYSYNPTDTYTAHRLKEVLLLEADCMFSLVFCHTGKRYSDSNPNDINLDYTLTQRTPPRTTLSRTTKYRMNGTEYRMNGTEYRMGHNHERDKTGVRT